MLGEGDWSELPRNSQIFYDARLKLINTYQYHQDFYFGDETFLKVLCLDQPFKDHNSALCRKKVLVQ